MNFLLKFSSLFAGYNVISNVGSMLENKLNISKRFHLKLEFVNTL